MNEDRLGMHFRRGGSDPRLDDRLMIRNLIERRLADLPSQLRTAFAAACAERLLPLYVRFHELRGWGDPDVVALAVERAWNLGDGMQLPRAEIESLADRCLAAAPDMDDFAGDEYASAGLNAAVAAHDALSCWLKDGDVRSAADTATGVEDTLDQFTDPQLGMDVTTFDPLILQEIAWQWTDIAVLAGMSRNGNAHPSAILRDSARRRAEALCAALAASDGGAEA
jgi:uncharacterized protein YjaG (DUF416 family)